MNIQSFYSGMMKPLYGFAESHDLPGLILESASFDTLVERVKKAVPELLELSGIRKRRLKFSRLS